MPFFLTTAIDYVNASPHLGHAYEKVAADAIARYHRLRGEDVFFLTGTDENAQKNVAAAKAAGKPVKQFVDEMTQAFVRLCEAYGISSDRFIRTTEAGHRRVAQEIFSRIQKAGDIYQGTYTGLYCQGCEAFYTEKDLQDGTCPEHGTKPQHLSEENYFFRLSKYQAAVKRHIEAHPEFLQPETRRNEILSRLSEPVNDVSVSRNVSWGIPVPGDETQRIYVWFDALLNYISGLDYPGPRYKKFWPADLHVIGTGITWFHTVIWPAMLLSAGLPLPKRVFVHGYLTIGGKKMSKSLGNVVDPLALAKAYPADAVRYALLRRIPFGEDGDFTEAGLKQAIRGELAAGLGNLLNRAVTLGDTHGGPYAGALTLPQQLDVQKIEGHLDRLELHHALEEAFRFVGLCNKYIDETKPWKLGGKERGAALNNVLESLRLLSIILSPFIPVSAEAMAKQLGVPRGGWKDLTPKPFAGAPKKGAVLFLLAP